MIRSWFLLLLSVALAGSGMAYGADQASKVAAHQAVVVYDGPSEGKPLYLLSLNYPLLILSQTQEWLKVCLHDGDLGYVRQRDARLGSTAIAKSRTAVRVDPNNRSKVAFTVDKQQLLFVQGDPIGGWLPVRHTEGKNGFADIRTVFSAISGGEC